MKELSLRFRVLASSRAPWMDVASPRRAVLALPPERGHCLTVRNRRPGDHIRPLGWDQSCRVKDLLINRKVPRRDRSLLPLLASGSDVIWIPGVTVDDRYRVGAERQVGGADRTECRPDGRVWVAEIDRPGPRL